MDLGGDVPLRKRGRNPEDDDGEETEQGGAKQQRRMGTVVPWPAQPPPQQQNPASRIYRVSRGSGGKDRHSKVYTAKGIRDRRVRLSVATAIQFYDLQDRLGYDQPSKAVEWLIKAAAAAIDKLPSLDASAFPNYPASASAAHNNKPHADASQQQLTRSGCSSTSETSKGSVLSLSRSDSRVKARDRSARDKDDSALAAAGTTRRATAATSSAQAASFTELLTGLAVASAAAGTTTTTTTAAAAAAQLLAADGRHRRLPRLRAAPEARPRDAARRLRLPCPAPRQHCAHRHGGAHAALQLDQCRAAGGHGALLLLTGPLHARPCGGGGGSGGRRLQPQLLHVLGSRGCQQQGDPSVQFAAAPLQSPPAAAPEAGRSTGCLAHTLLLQPGSHRGLAQRGGGPLRLGGGRRVSALGWVPALGRQGEGQELTKNCPMRLFLWMVVKTTNHRNIFMRAPSIALNFHKSLGMIPTGMIPSSSQKPTIMRTSATLIEEPHHPFASDDLVLCFFCLLLYSFCLWRLELREQDLLQCPCHQCPLQNFVDGCICPEPARLTLWDQLSLSFFLVLCCDLCEKTH